LLAKLTGTQVGAFLSSKAQNPHVSSGENIHESRSSDLRLAMRWGNCAREADLHAIVKSSPVLE
jgi:hypothetical protein